MTYAAEEGSATYEGFERVTVEPDGGHFFTLDFE
jgi:hypothetical protein